MDKNHKESFELLLRKHLSSEAASWGSQSPCPDENWMAAYLEGTAGEPRRVEFEKHLIKCQRCQAELALLLKSETAPRDEAPNARALPAARRRMNLAWLLAWSRPLVLRPALAVLVVGLISSVVGYQLIRQPETAGPAEEFARTLTKETSTLAPQARSELADSTSAAPAQEEAVKPLRAAKDSAQGLRINAETRGKMLNERIVPPQSRSEQDRRSFDKAENSYALELPPSSMPESQSPKNQNAAREDETASPRAPAEPAEALKASGDADETRFRRVQTDTIAASSAGSPSKEGLRDRSHPAPAPSSPAAVTLSKKQPEKKTKPAETPSTSVPVSAHDKRDAVISRHTLGALQEQPQRIEAGGKVFELVGNVWRDSSVNANETASPILIAIPSEQFERQRQLFAPFQPVLARPEDALIKLNNRVYRLEKIRR